MKVVRPLPISLTASSVPETDYPAWDSGTTYALGARVIVAALHRVFESVSGGNVGHAPAAGGSSFWLDVGPTNRWAMFDQAAGPATRANASLVVTLALSDDADTIGLVDLQAASVRVEIASAGVPLLDTIRGAPAACEVFLGLPAGTARSATITIEPTGGAAVVGKLITGGALNLGTLADAPTVGLTDFSRRETDAFGVTTIAERGWTKRIEAKCRIDDAAVDAIQQQLAAIRAQAALWIGEGDFPSLIAYGIFKDFSQVISLQGVSTCSLSIEGYPAADIAMPASDPALNGASDFQVVRPATVTDAVLVSSSAPENDFPMYAAATAYVAGARVILPATHRAYESLTAGNLGHDPASSPGNWVDIGPTNRWAMFDQALGSATTAVGPIVVQLKPSTFADTIVVLDVIGSTVRVQAPGYDQTRALGGNVTSALFLDLVLAAGDTATVTIAGANIGAAVAVGTLLIGAREGLGTLADEPTVGILDFSVKDTDDFGNTVPLERAWAKRMEAKSQIATAGAAALLRRLATLRAKPSLWIGAAELDALTIYGFFRDFTVSLGERVSTCSVTIEGMAKAAPELPSQTIALTAYLTNEDHTVPADAAGNVTSYAGAGGTFIIRDGAEEVQSSFNFTVVENPQGLAVAFNGASYAVTGGLDAAKDAAAVTIKAVGFGSYSGITATKQFSLSKSKAGGAGGAGAPGAAAKLLSILSNRQTISYDGAGAPVPADQTITFKVNKQNTAATVYWTITDASGAAVSLAYLSAASGDTVYMTEHNFALARGSTSGVIVTGTLTDGATIADSISVVAVAAGAAAVDSTNRLKDTGFTNLDNWFYYLSSGVVLAYRDVGVNTPTGKRVLVADAAISGSATDRQFLHISQLIPYTVGQRYAFQAAIEAYNAATGTGTIKAVHLCAGFWRANGSQSGEKVLQSLNGQQGFPTYMRGFLEASDAPSDTATFQLFVRYIFNDGTSGILRVSMAEPMVSLSRASQTEFPPYTPGVVDGKDGKDGNDGVPGQPGANGQTLYNWYAFADSPDGYVNFTTGTPGGRGYQGIAVNKTTPTEGMNADDYQWGPYRGPASFGLVAQSNVTIGPDYIVKTGTTGQWDGSAFSSEAFIGGAFASVLVTPSSAATVFGLNTDPTTNASWETIDYALYVENSADRKLFYMESGALVQLGNWNVGDKLQITYDNKTVRYLQNGNEIRSIGAVPNLRLYFDSSIAEHLKRISDIKFGPAGSVGADGQNGQDGQQGPQGPQGPAGANGGAGSPGTPAVYLKVTRKAVSVEAYSNGLVKSFANANGQLSVMSGSTDVTASAFLSASASGCTGTINTDFGTPVAGQPKGYYQVTDLSADTGALTLSATYGGQTITEIFSVSKLLGGYEIVSSLPNSNVFEGRIVYLLADKKLYRFDGSSWNRSADGADLAPNSVTTNALAAGAVTATQINVTYLSAITQTVGFLTSRVNGQGAGFEMDNNGYRLFAANNVMAVEIAV